MFEVAIVLCWMCAIPAAHAAGLGQEPKSQVTEVVEPSFGRRGSGSGSGSGGNSRPRRW